jgi:hypothetical protein
MRTVPFKTVVDAVVRLHGIDPRGDVPSDLLNAVVDHANARVETALLAWDWQEWNRTEERAYRQTWNAATQFKRVNGDGVPDEFFYIPNMTYYTVLSTAVSDPPIGTLPTNTTYFAVLDPIDTYLQYDQPCKRSIGQVLGIYSANPRTNCCNNGSCYKYHPSEFGVDICSGRGPTVFVWYQMPTPRYSMTPYLVGKTYNRGDVVFDPITGECYQALSTTTLAPASGPWNRVPFLQKWFNFVRFGAFADSLGEIDRSGTLDPNVQIAAGQNAEAKAMNALQQQIDSMVMQGQKLRWNFKGCGRYWCESLPWNGSGTVTTLTDECQADAGWVYPPEPGTVFVTEIIGVISGITPLISGQDYIDVVFGSAQPSVDWTPLETSIVNTVDPTPVNVWPGVISNQTENGFRLQLNGTPDSGNYNLYWSIKGASGYFMAGPSTGPSGTPSTAFEVSLPDESGLIGTVIITPHDGGGGGTFTPATVALTTAAPTATFTYTPASSGAKTISVTNNRALTNPASRTYTVIHVPVLVVHDSFTDANGTALPSHTMDLGTGWTRFKGTGLNQVTIQSNKAQSFTDGATEYAYSTESGVSDATVEASVVFGGADNFHLNMMILRFTDASNFWACRIAGDGVITLRKYVGGVETIVDTDAVSVIAGTPIAVSAVLSGTSIAVTAGGVTVNATDSFNQSATKHGFSTYLSSGTSNTIDEFKVTG